ncbi:hypothetical protein V8E52_006108 [Russula decolorans]
MLAPTPEPPSNTYKPLSPAHCPGQFHSVYAPFNSRLPLSTGLPSSFPKTIIHSFPAMNCYGERRAYDVYDEEQDPYSTSRAGSFDFVDAVLPWRSDEVSEPLPPPVPPKNDLKVRSAVAASAASISGRVTPWLLRRVKAPVTRATKTAPAPAPQKANSTDIRGSLKPAPPAYHVVLPQPQPQPQQQINPSEERVAIMTTSRGLAAAAAVQSQQSTVQVQPRTPPKPPAPHRSARGRGGETQRGPPASHSGCPQLRSVRSAPHTDRSRDSRRPGARAPPPTPLRPAATVQSERAHLVLPSYHSAQPFPSPAPPPYRASAEDSYPTSVRSRSLPRSSRNKYGGRTFEKEAAPLPPLPLPSHPRLSSSAISRIQAGHKVSKEFGDAIMQQELRLATPTSDHHSRPDPVPNPRLGRRFLSASELQSHRRAKLRTDKIPSEHEARQRMSNKSSPNVGRCSANSRQRAVSAHPGRGQDKGSQRSRI